MLVSSHSVFVVTVSTYFSSSSSNSSASTSSSFSPLCFLFLFACPLISFLPLHLLLPAFPSYLVFSGYASTRFLSLGVILTWLKILKFMRPFPLFGPFIVILGDMTTDVLTFSIIYTVLWVPISVSPSTSLAIQRFKLIVLNL